MATAVASGFLSERIENMAAVAAAPAPALTAAMTAMVAFDMLTVHVVTMFFCFFLPRLGVRVVDGWTVGVVGVVFVAVVFGRMLLQGRSVCRR